MNIVHLLHVAQLSSDTRPQSLSLTVLSVLSSTVDSTVDKAFYSNARGPGFDSPSRISIRQTLYELKKENFILLCPIHWLYNNIYKNNKAKGHIKEHIFPLYQY